MTEQEIIEVAKEILLGRLRTPERAISCPQDAKDLAFLELAGKEREEFVCFFLDTRHGLISVETVSTGTIDGASVYPREVVKLAMKHNAAAAIFAHNHPSGNAEPSQADRTITERLKQALSLVDVRVLDHLVVGREVFSFTERGLL